MAPDYPPMSSRSGFWVAAVVLVGAAVWATRLVLAPDYFADSSGSLLGLSLLAAAAVASLGIVLSHGRWARRLAVVVIAGQAGLAATMDLGVWGWTAVAATALSTVAIAGPWLDAYLRKLPPADAPPAAAVVLALGLVLSPAAVALSAPAGLTAWHWVAAGVLVGAAWSYSRALILGLWAARLLVPATLLIAAAASPAAGLVFLVAVAGSLGGLAWTGGAARAVTPLLPKPGRGVAVPPQLVPAELLAKAGYDESGRRIEKDDQ